MEHKLITVGLSADHHLMNKDTIRQLGKLARTIAPLIHDKNVNIISTEHANATVCSEIIRQILKSLNKMDMYNDLGSDNVIPYYNNGEEILSHTRSRDFIFKQLQSFEILIVVCQDNMNWGNKPFKVLSGLDFPGLPLKAQTLNLQALAY